MFMNRVHLEQTAEEKAKHVKTSRTTPCPCGSGQTFKKCCQAHGESDFLTMPAGRLAAPHKHPGTRRNDEKLLRKHKRLKR